MLRDQYWNRKLSSHNHARQIVLESCDSAERQLGLASTPVIMEYVFGGCNALDDYSSFLTPGRLDDLFNNIEGEFVGIGIEMKADREGNKASQVQGQARLESRDKKRQETVAAFRAENLQKRAEALREIASLEQQILKEERRAEDRRLRAPVAGTVFGLSVFTIGGVVTTKDTLLRIVPEGSRLEAEIVVLNRDIGFVAEHQPAEVKLETFPFTRYGLIEGEVTQVSHDAVPDEKQGLVYKATVALKTDKILVGDKWVPLAPGMQVQAEVKTGERRVISYFLSPLLRYRDESLRER
jgi:hemolysin D